MLRLEGEQHAEDAHPRRRPHELPLALDPVGEGDGQQRAERRGDGDDEGVEQALAQLDAGLLRDQRRHPGGEAVEAEGLEELEHAQHQRAGAIRLHPDLGEAPLVLHVHGVALHRRRQRGPAEVGLHPRLHGARDRVRLRQPPVLDQPARALGHLAAQHPDEHRPHRADRHHPAPAVDAERAPGHQQVGQQRHDRHGGELHHLVEGEGAAAHVLGHQLGDVGVDRHQLHADADTRDQPPQAHAEPRGLERHDQGRGAVPQQRDGEDDAPAVAVRHEAEPGGADEQSGEGGGHEQRGAAEHAQRDVGEQPRAHQPRHHVSGDEQVVELEQPAQREQRHQLPDVGRGRQAVEPRQDGGGAVPLEAGVWHGGGWFPRAGAGIALLALVAGPARECRQGGHGRQCRARAAGRSARKARGLAPGPHQGRALETLRALRAAGARTSPASGARAAPLAGPGGAAPWRVQGSALALPTNTPGTAPGRHQGSPSSPRPQVVVTGHRPGDARPGTFRERQRAP